MTNKTLKYKEYFQNKYNRVYYSGNDLVFYTAHPICLTFLNVKLWEIDLFYMRFY